ncbi:MAG TPA: spore coat U domain-containing protein [Pirellulales bacterium]|nr:spore coat U domain-containing protein [Rhizomicrobium sp.]HVU88983.1 spore coat U domain-containing protein [Pirellulales bacterium]
MANILVRQRFFHPAILISLASFVLASPLEAATVQVPFAVSATVQQVCAVAATNLSFGSYDASLGSPDDATGTITVTCTPSSSYSIALNAGTTSGGTEAARLMSDGNSHTLTYDLFTDAGHTTKWGDGTMSTVLVSGTADGTHQNYTLYGQVGTGQFVPSGDYTDTVTATVNY